MVFFSGTCSYSGDTNLETGPGVTGDSHKVVTLFPFYLFSKTWRAAWCSGSYLPAQAPSEGDRQTSVSASQKSLFQTKPHQAWEVGGMTAAPSLSLGKNCCLSWLWGEPFP